ncbi:MAG: glycosyltransferase family 2 protein [Chloroflexi bacterium]|nr:glycosyltransferase family 2 protein [Chloroflexota bacterium]
MRLFIQIPCYNEAATLPQVISNLPKTIPNVHQVEVLVIDDGSTDNTSMVARQLGVQHVVHHAQNRGLAMAFQTGLEACLRLGADIIVNTDGDNQYPSDQIPKLIEPILQGRADIVIGDRQTHTIAHFSPFKKILQQWGSWVVRIASGTNVPDATSGFRAYSREAALRLNVLTNYTYTLETIIQAGKKGLVVAPVPIQINEPLRQSRLIKNNWSYVKHSIATIMRLYALYEPFRTFMYMSLPFLLTGLVLIGRFAIVYLSGNSGLGRLVQSVAIGGTSLIIGFLLIMLGIIGDLIATNRRLTEEMLYRLKCQELTQSRAPLEHEPHSTFN